MGLFKAIRESIEFEKKRQEVLNAPPKPSVPMPDIHKDTYAEIWLSNTKVCKDTLRNIATIYTKDKSKTLSWNEALHRYYNKGEQYFPWEFNVRNIEIEETVKGFAVYGDGLHLGDIKKSSVEGSDYWMICELRAIDGIQKIQAKIKNRSDYFNVSSAEYANTEGFDPEKDDVFKRGVNAWFDQNNPKIAIRVFFDPDLLGIDMSHALKCDASFLSEE